MVVILAVWHDSVTILSALVFLLQSHTVHCELVIASFVGTLIAAVVVVVLVIVVVEMVVVPRNGAQLSSQSSLALILKHLLI